MCYLWIRLAEWVVLRITNEQMERYQPILLRELTLREKQKIFLLEHLNNVEAFKKLNAVFDCESNWNQDVVNYKSGDYGIAQINEYTWDKTAKTLGLDYKNSWQDNLLMAIYIYHQEGLKPWNWSKSCWSKLK